MASRARRSRPWDPLRAAAVALLGAASVGAIFLGMQATLWAAPPAAQHGGKGLASRLGGGAAGARRLMIARHAESAEAAASGIRVGVLQLAGEKGAFKEAFEKLNVTNETFFETEVPDAFQMPLAAKLLAMSNTVDVIVAAHGELQDEKAAVLRGYQTVALTTNVPIVPCDGAAAVEDVAGKAVQMGEIRQQAIMGGGPRKSTFFGIGTNRTGSAAPGEKKKIYF